MNIKYRRYPRQRRRVSAPSRASPGFLVENRSRIGKMARSGCRIERKRPSDRGFPMNSTPPEDDPGSDPPTRDDPRRNEAIRPEAGRSEEVGERPASDSRPHAQEWAGNPLPIPWGATLRQGFGRSECLRGVEARSPAAKRSRFPEKNSAQSVRDVTESHPSLESGPSEDAPNGSGLGLDPAYLSDGRP